MRIIAQKRISKEEYDDIKDIDAYVKHHITQEIVEHILPSISIDKENMGEYYQYNASLMCFDKKHWRAVITHLREFEEKYRPCGQAGTRMLEMEIMAIIERAEKELELENEQQ